jgi:hypothetical protein
VGPYQRITDTLGDIHERVIEALSPGDGDRWLDLATGTGALGDAFDLELEEHVSTFRVPSGEAYWELFSTSYGPTKVLADTLGDRRAELHRDWVDFFDTNYRSDGEIVHTREYLFVRGRRR